MKSVWKSQNGNVIIVKKYHAPNALPSNPKIKEKRAERENLTSELQQKINQRHRAEKFQRELLDNFKAGDWYITLTYGGGEALEKEKVTKDLRNFMDRLRRRFKRKDVSFKWIRVIENLEGRGRPHAHLIIPQEIAGFEELNQMLKEIWPNGFVKAQPYGGTATDAWRIAEYFCKEMSKGNGGDRHSSSRNLIRREPQRTKITRAETYDDNIKAPEGYVLIKELSNVYTTQDSYPVVKAVFERAASPPKEHRRRKRSRAIWE